VGEDPERRAMSFAVQPPFEALNVGASSAGEDGVDANPAAGPA